MTDRHDAARAALEAALAATSSSGRTSPTAGPPAAGPASAAAVADLRGADGEPDASTSPARSCCASSTMAPKSRPAAARTSCASADCPDDVAEAVLDRLTEVGLVDDEAYAGMLVRSQQAGRGLARRALARELRTKGVDDETAGATLDVDRPRGRAGPGPRTSSPRSCAPCTGSSRRGADPPAGRDAGPQGLLPPTCRSR